MHPCFIPGTNETPEQSKGHFLPSFCGPGQKEGRLRGRDPRDFDCDLEI